MSDFTLKPRTLTEQEIGPSGKLPIWRFGRITKYFATVDPELQPLLASIGRWSLSLSHGKLVGSPRISIQCVDPENKEEFQLNLQLHRVVFSLGVLDAEQQRKLVADMDMLISVQRKLPKISTENGSLLDCRFENLTAKISKRTEQRRRESGAVVEIEGAFPRSLIEGREQDLADIAEEARIDAILGSVNLQDEIRKTAEQELRKRAAEAQNKPSLMDRLYGERAKVEREQIEQELGLGSGGDGSEESGGDSIKENLDVTKEPS